MPAKLLSETWREQALCYTDPTFPRDRLYAKSAAERRPARDACLSCPVRLDCLKSALERREVWGVWGANDQDELRRALSVNADGVRLKRIRPPHCPSCRAQPRYLIPVATCEMGTRRERHGVLCLHCEFSWVSATSAAAVRAYWRERAAHARRLALQARAEARMSQRALRPMTIQQMNDTVTQDDMALVASAAYVRGT